MKRANVKSIDSIRQFKLDLQDYNHAIRHALDMLNTELMRAVDYLETDRSVYWPAQVRRASDKVSEARINLERCQVTTRPGEGPSCYEEKKSLQHAKERLATANAKVKATKKWLVIVRKEVDEFRSRMAQVNFSAESELPRAAALLERLAARLDRYVSKMDSDTSDSSSLVSPKNQTADASHARPLGEQSPES